MIHIPIKQNAPFLGRFFTQFEILVPPIGHFWRDHVVQQSALSHFSVFASPRLGPGIFLKVDLAVTMFPILLMKSREIKNHPDQAIL
jgi:hypothetical protein